MKAKRVSKGVYEIAGYTVENMMITMGGEEVDRDTPWRITKDGEWVIDTNALWYAKEMIGNWNENKGGIK